MSHKLLSFAILALTCCFMSAQSTHRSGEATDSSVTVNVLSQADPQAPAPPPVVIYQPVPQAPPPHASTTQK
jgi:hypothetical protein